MKETSEVENLREYTHEQEKEKFIKKFHIEWQKTKSEVAFEM